MIIYKLLLKEVKQEPEWEGFEDKDVIKLGEVAFDFKGKTDDTEFDLKKGDKLYYQYGTPAKIEGEEYILVSLTSFSSSL